MRSENGFTLLEMAVAITMSAMIAFTATIFAFHALRTSARTDDQLMAMVNAQNAGFWISRDTEMADMVITDNLTAPAFLVLKWTEWGYGDEEDNIYYAATYSMENVAGGVGQLVRELQSSSGINQNLLVANHIYYNPADPGNSTNITYQSPVLNLRAVTHFGSANATRNYQIYRRPNF